MTTETIEQPREDVVVEQSTAAPAPADTWSELDQALADYDARVSQPEPAPDNSAHTSRAQDPLDQLLAEFNVPSADQQRITELTERNTAYEQERAFSQLRESVVKFADELQEVCPNINVRERLELMEGRDPNLIPAFQCSGLSDAERAVARADYQAAEKLYQRWLAEPDSNPNKQSTLRHLEAEGKRLWTMVNGKQILQNAIKAIRKENADKVPDMTHEDWMVTADRDMVYAAIRDGGSGREPPPMPQPKLGELDTQEYRRHVRETYGFDPNV
jgi:hypothetical protein